MNIIMKDIVKLLIIALVFIPQVVAVEPEPSLIKKKGLNSTISASTLSNDGNSVVIAYYDGSIQVLDKNLNLQWANQTNSRINDVAVSSNGGFIVAAIGSKLILFKEKELHWKLHWIIDLGLVSDVSISGEGNQVLAVSSTDVNYITNARTISPVSDNVFKTNSPIESGALSKEGDLIAVGDQNSVYLFSLKNGLLWSYELYDLIYDIAISPEGEYLVVGTKGGFVYLFSKDGSLVWSIDLGSPVQNVALSKWADYIVVGTESGAQLLDNEGIIIWGVSGKVAPGVGINNGGTGFTVGIDDTISLFNIPETRPPQISLTSPISGSRVSEFIKITTKTIRSPKTSIYIDGQQISKKADYSLDTRFLSNGWHTITVEGRNFQGNVDSETVDIIVDNGEISTPSVKIIGYKEGDILSGSKDIFAILNTPFEETSFYVDGEEISKEIPYAWNTRNHKNGIHEISIVAKHLGETYIDSINIFVDNTDKKSLPHVKIVSPLRSKKIEGTSVIRAVFGELPSEIYVKLDDKIVSSSLPYLWDTETEEFGKHQITVFAINEKGTIGQDSMSVTKNVVSDLDNDGWINEKENLFRTNPQVSDTDGDGIKDSIDEDPLRNQKVNYIYLYSVLFLISLSAFLIKEKDLKYNLILTSIAIVLVIIEPLNKVFLRIPFSIFLVFFAPGYAFISTLFPKNEISMVERSTLSIVTSIIILVFWGFILNYTSGFRLAPITLTLSLTTLIFVTTSAILRNKYGRGESFKIDFRFLTPSRESFTGLERALLTVLVFSILISGVMFVYAKLSYETEKFSAFYILGENGKADVYSDSFYLGDSKKIKVGVENYEGVTSSYNLEIKLNDILLHKEAFKIEDKERWIKDIQLTLNQAGERLKLEFLLYKAEESLPYRSLHLWITVRPNYGYPNSYAPYTLRSIPVVENWNFEIADLGWNYNSTNSNFTGRFDDYMYASPPHSYKLSIASGLQAIRNDYASISQVIFSEKGTAILSFKVRNNNLWGRYYKQILLNEKVVWEGSSQSGGWEHFTVPINMISGPNKLELRLFQHCCDSRPVSLWWDDIRIESIDSLFVM
jgi:uncharacterized membrane protein